MFFQLDLLFIRNRSHQSSVAHRELDFLLHPMEKQIWGEKELLLFRILVDGLVHNKIAREIGCIIATART